MKATKNIDICLIGKRPVRVIDVVQYDTGIQLVFTVKDFTIPSDATATLYVQKPSGKFVYQEKNITIANNAITVDLENQALTEYGRTSYQVTVSSGSDTVTSFAGLMIVERSLKDAGAVESTTVIKAFDEVTERKISEFQARARTIADAVIATIPDDYTELTAKVNESANAIKGMLSGAVVAADDVSPVEHLPVVKVRGKNLLHYPYLVSTHTMNGITYTDNGDGSFTLNGTSTANFAIVFLNDMNLVLDGVYTFSMNNAFKGAGGLYLKNANGQTVMHVASGDKHSTANINDTITRFDMWINSGKTFDNFTICPQLEKGESPTEYIPYVDPSTVTVTRCGKNLLPYPFYQSSSEINGCKFTANSDGSVSGSGTATGVSYLTIYNGNPLVKQGKFTLSISGNYQNIIYHFIMLDSDGNELLVLQDYLTKTINADDYPTATKWMLNIKRHENKTVSGRVYPQIEVGEMATSHEGYIEPVEYIPTSDGVVSGVTSLSPNMTIMTDTEGVIVECEYNKDTNMVIQKFADALGITI